MLTSSTHEWLYCYLRRGGDSGEEYLSAQEILHASEQLALNLIKQTPENSSVVISLEHGPDFLISLFACFFAKRVVVPAPLPRFESGSSRIASMCEQFEHTTILTREPYFESISQLINHDENRLNMLCIDALKKVPAVSCSKNDLPGLKVDDETPLIIQFTSGSTSTPKGVVITSKNIAANKQQVAHRWLFHINKTHLTWLPYYHDMGLFGGLIYPLLHGQKVVQMDPLHFVQKPLRWLKAVSKFKVNVSGGPAFAYELCNEIPVDSLPSDLDFSHWEVAYCGADYVPASTMRQFRETFAKFNLNPRSLAPVYGLAEATLFIAGEPPQENTHPACSENHTEGCYLGGEDNRQVEIRAVDSDSLLTEGQYGEVCIFGDSISQGYFKHDTGFSPDFFRTGDLGFIEDNYLFLCGRIKDVLILHGQNISPSTIEQLAAATSEQLNPHAAAAFQPSANSSNVVLFIEVKKAANNGLQQSDTIRSTIARQVQQQTGITLAKIAFLKRGELMRTSSGKVQRKVVAEQYENGHSFKEVRHADS